MIRREWHPRFHHCWRLRKTHPHKEITQASSTRRPTSARKAASFKTWRAGCCVAASLLSAEQSLWACHGPMQPMLPYAPPRHPHWGTRDHRETIPSWKFDYGHIRGKNAMPRPWRTCVYRPALSTGPHAHVIRAEPIGRHTLRAHPFDVLRAHNLS